MTGPLNPDYVIPANQNEKVFLLWLEGDRPGFPTPTPTVVSEALRPMAQNTR